MDREAERQFREFVQAHSQVLLRSAYALTGDMHRAEDLLQEALTKLAGRWRRVDNPLSYARRIIYHDHISWWRRRRVVEKPTGVVPDPMPDGGWADPADRVGQRLDVQHALSQLGRRQRAVLLLRFYEDLPERTVADLLGCSVGTVRSQTFRGLARLRRIAPELAISPPDRSVDSKEALA